jgi:hypothetical protein
MRHSDGGDFPYHPLASGTNGAQVEKDSARPDRVALSARAAQHEHLFWFVAIVLAFIDIPDFLTPVNRIASSVATMAGQEADAKPADVSTSDPSESAEIDEPQVKKQGVSHA